MNICHFAKKSKKVLKSQKTDQILGTIHSYLFFAIDNLFRYNIENV